MIKRKDLSMKDREFATRLLQTTYLHGGCYHFAIALHREFGWPMYGIIQGDTIPHVALRPTPDHFFDARGYFPVTEFGTPFNLHPPLTIQEVTEEKLFTKIENDPCAIQAALDSAEKIFPDLPWKNSFGKKVENFLADLGNLCRKHGVWIRAPYPNMRIVIDRMHGDEGFTYEPAVTSQYFFDRHLEGQVD